MAGLPRRPRAAGFTLIELLAGLAVAGIVLAALSAGFRSVLDMRDRVARAAIAAGDLATADETLRRLVAGIDPGMTIADPPMFEGAAHSVRFVSGGRAYRVELDRARRLVIDYSEPFADITGDPRAGRAALLEGLERLDIAYRRQDGPWLSTWREARLPGSIRFHLVLPEGSGQTVPDVIAAPMRMPWRF